MKSKIGQKAEYCDNLGDKDAVHVPVVLTECKIDLEGGTKVCFKDNSFKEVYPVSSNAVLYHGVVDPFVSVVRAYSAFLVMLVPSAVEKFNHTFDVNLPSLPSSYIPQSSTEDEDDSCRGCY